MEKRLGRLISMLYRKSQVYLSQELKNYDVTSAEYPILIALNQNNGVTQEELSSHLYLDKSAVTRVIQALIEKGFVTKSKDERDLRCNRVYLTEKGRKVQKPIKDSMDNWNDILMMHMEKEKQDIIYELLMRMVENVNEEFLERK